MSRRTVDDDDDYSDDEGEPLVPCPYCKREILEDVAACPYCGNHISSEDASPSRKPWWIIIGALLCLYAVYRWIVG